jgi:hypothetical protein
VPVLVANLSNVSPGWTLYVTQEGGAWQTPAVPAGAALVGASGSGVAVTMISNGVGVKVGGNGMGVSVGRAIVGDGGSGVSVGIVGVADGVSEGGSGVSEGGRGDVVGETVAVEVAGASVGVELISTATGVSSPDRSCIAKKMAATTVSNTMTKVPMAMATRRTGELIPFSFTGGSVDTS